MLSIRRAEARCSSAGPVSTPSVVATSMVSSASLRASQSKSAPRGVDACDPAPANKSAGWRVASDGFSELAAHCASGLSASNAATCSFTSSRSASRRTCNSWVSASIANSLVPAEQGVAARRSSLLCLSSANSAKCSSSASSSSAPRAARAAAAALISKGSASDWIKPEVGMLSGTLSPACDKDANETSESPISPWSEAAAASFAALLQLSTTRAAMASLIARAIPSCVRCLGFFSSNPSIAARTSPATSFGKSGGLSSQMRRTRANWFAASNGRRNAATSYKQAPSAQASAGAPYASPETISGEK
mmetsp:Transcript_18352/g.35971  ORF Transcript_18352/g.35971 Transcript_18352/m.35971 type:complete len:306 (-) Transcript_18352:614-1531(-)